MSNHIDREKSKPFIREANEDATRVVHGGETADFSATPVYLGNSTGDHYTRFFNPTISALESKFRELERGHATIATASGMAAVSQALLGVLKHGDRLLVHDHIFIGCRTLFQDFLPRYGIEVCTINLNDLDMLEQHLMSGFHAVYFEVISHPEMVVVDAPSVINLIKKYSALAIVDNTCLTPVLCSPLQYGADLIIYSATKFIGGHGQALGGLITVRDESIGEEIRKARRILGGVLSPSNASHLQSGLKTLPLRMEKHCQNAMSIAKFLEQHAKVKAVNYPGLSSSPYHRFAAKFMKAFGGLLSFKLSEPSQIDPFVASLRLCQKRMSFGEPDTRVHLYGHTDLIRLSAGLEDEKDLLYDLEQALASL